MSGDGGITFMWEITRVRFSALPDKGGCPLYPPNTGLPCITEGLPCKYSYAEKGSTCSREVSCTDGYWVDLGLSCYD